MRNRGPILILFAGSLALSPVAIRMWNATEAPSDTSYVNRIQLLGSAMRDCEAETVETRSYRIGCGARNPTDRRERAGGAVFVPARR